MAKERMINTRIWSDNWVSKLDPLEKLLFLYFLTNTYTNISGIYELPIKVAAVETGIDPSMFEKMLPHLEPKIIYKHGWVILPNFPKYQNTENPKIMAGIQRELSDVPKEIHTLSIAYGYPIALIPIPIPILIPNLPEEEPITEELTEPEVIKGSGQVLAEFRKFNKSPVLMNKGEADSCRRMISSYGLGVVLDVVRCLAEINKIPYVTPATTPKELERSWTKIEAQLEKQKRITATPVKRGRGVEL